MCSSVLNPTRRMTCGARCVLQTAGSTPTTSGCARPVRHGGSKRRCGCPPPPPCGRAWRTTLYASSRPTMPPNPRHPCMRACCAAAESQPCGAMAGASTSSNSHTGTCSGRPSPSAVKPASWRGACRGPARVVPECLTGKKPKVPPDAGTPCPDCHRLRGWEFDATAQTGHLRCACGRQPRPLARATAAPAGCPHAPSSDLAPAHGPWYDVGPPAGDPRSPTNSWLYVPLLHAACGALSPHAAEAWDRDERCQPWWREACHTLRHAAAVPAALLVDALREAAARHHAPLPQTIFAAAQALPSGAELHLSWVVRQIAAADGYIHAGAQEVCLQLYGGLSFAANLDRYSDAFRRGADEAPAPPAPTCPRPANTDPARQSDGDDACPRPANTDPARQSDGDDAVADGSQDDEVAAVVSERAPGAAQQRCGRGGGRRGRKTGRGHGTQNPQRPMPRRPHRPNCRRPRPSSVSALPPQACASGSSASTTSISHLSCAVEHSRSRAP